MSDYKDNEGIEDLRERLYAREGGPEQLRRHKLTDEKKPVRTAWNEYTPKPSVSGDPVKPETKEPLVVSTPSVSEQTTSLVTPMPKKSKRQSYRLKLLLAGLFFFVVAVGLSSIFIIFGGNSISGDNISVNVSGPFTIGGGEIMPLQIGVTNQNSVPIESATLIIEYPAGTKAVDDDKELFTERLPLDVIGSGEAVNVPVRVKVYGEENDELMVRVSVEYRVRGSNATFFKEAEPLVFKISSSPIAIAVDAVSAIASGQETDIVLTVRSNASNDITDLLVKAEYPNSFDYTSATPRPVSGKNVWLIEKLSPEEETKITIRGAMVGSETETHTINFSVGVASERDRYTLASIFSTAVADFLIEDPFLNLTITANNVSNGVLAVPVGSQSSVSVEVENTLNDTIYDGVVALKLSGNALSNSAIQVANGYYDSNTNTVTWDVTSEPRLEQMVPGSSLRFTFSINPQISGVQTPQIAIDAAVRARRVSEARAQEEIVGTVESVIKIISDLALTSVVGYNTTNLSDSGPVPPRVGQNTTYAVTFEAQNGSNEVTGVSTVATLPSYVTWTGQTTGLGTFEYNPTSREVTWTVGKLGANGQALGSFQVSILPSASQIGTTPTIVTEQRLSATDNFTDAPIRVTSPALTTKLPEAAGYDRNSGVVQP